MSLDHIFILLITHGLPMLLFMFMSIDIWLRNHRNIEHILVACMCLSYFLMFLVELIRNVASIEYSPFISSYFFSSLGILSLAFSTHYILHVTKLAAKLPNWLNPYLFYIPVIPIIINIVTDAKLFSTQQFEQIGVWIFPIYDSSYYATLTGSILVNFIFIVPIAAVYKKASPDQQTVFKALILMLAITGIANIILGFGSFPHFVPPYPYLYSGLVFCFFLRRIMKSTEFLQQYDKRFEKLFSMNPDGIFLLDQHLKIREINPVAKNFLNTHQIEATKLYKLLDPEVKKIIINGVTVRDLEFTITFDQYNYDVLLTLEKVTIDLHPHFLLMFRNVSALKEQQRKIEFLAFHDSLTKLPNRRYFFEKVPAILQQAYAKNETIAIYMLDMNNLKMVNDVYGHEAGDQAIQMLAAVLQDAVQQFGIVARVGGDEFIVCLNETESSITPQQLTSIILEAFSKKTTAFENIEIGTSIGYSHYPQQSDNINTLVTLADQMMYDMKKQKKVQYR